MDVRPADEGERAAIMTVFDAAMLAVDADAVGNGIDRGDVLVAAADDRVLGACLLDGEEIVAIAVRPGRRDQGIGSALVAGAADRRERLVAEFDPRVRPFWASLSFTIEPANGGGRLRGLHEGFD